MFNNQQAAAPSTAPSDTAALLLDSNSCSDQLQYYYGSTTATRQQQQDQQQQQDDTSSGSSSTKNMGLMFWTLALILAYTAERCTFKFLVDRSGPFRLFATEAVTGTYTLFLGTQMLFALRLQRNTRTSTINYFSTIFQLPPLDLGLIILLDSLQMLLAFIGGSHVLPVLTVTLTQFTTPLLLFLTQLTHKHGSCNILYSCALLSSPESYEDNDSTVTATVEGEDNDEQDNPKRSASRAASDENNNSCGAVGPVTTDASLSCGGYTVQHVMGAIIIFVALDLGLTPSILYIKNASLVQKQETMNKFMVTRAWNTMLYSSSFIPAAISQLLKEHMLTTYRQPVDTVQLNFTLSVFKFFTLGILAPFFYPLQGLMSGEATPYLSRDLSTNFQDGFLCIIGLLSEEKAQHKYAEPASCGIFSWMWIIGHVSSFIVLTFSVQKLVVLSSSSNIASGEQRQQLLVHQAWIAGLIVASFVMWLYTFDDSEAVEHGIGIGGLHVVDILHVSSFLLVIFGLELYHRNAIPGLTYETMYPEVENFSSEDD